MRIQENQQSIVDDRVTALVHLFHAIAGETQPEAAVLRVVPILVGHLLTVGAKPNDILDFRSTDPPSLKKMPAAQHGMRID